MLGRHHLMLSIATGFTILAPFIDFRPDFVALVLAGIGIGSLMPDADARDAAIFHDKVKGLDTGMGRLVNGTLAPTFPIFGYTNKYLVYRPAVFFYNKVVFRSYRLECHHRGFLHTLLGLATSTALIGTYIAGGLVLLGVFNPVYLSFFLLGYLSGGLMHLLQDSCTKTGIKWNHPFSQRKLRGRLITSSKPEDTRTPHIFLTVLGFTSLVSFLVGTQQLVPYNSFKISGITTLTTAILWSVFVLGVARVRPISP